MGLRFSLKWLLAAMVYAAVAAAAFTHQHWIYADLLWTVAVLGVAYAAVVACIARGPRQARALGFAVLTICFLVGLYAAPHALPTQRLVAALALPGEQPAAYAPPPATSAGVTFFGGSTSIVAAPTGAGQPTPTWNLNVNTRTPPPQAPAASGTLVISGPVPAQVATSTMANYEAFVLKLRSADAVAAMACGLAGALLGAMAYRAGLRSQAEPPSASTTTPSP